MTGRIGLMLDPQGLLDHHEGVSSSIHDMTAHQLQRVSYYIHDNDNLWDAYECAIEEAISTVLGDS